MKGNLCLCLVPAPVGTKYFGKDSCRKCGREIDATRTAAMIRRDRAAAERKSARALRRRAKGGLHPIAHGRPASMSHLREPR